MFIFQLLPSGAQSAQCGLFMYTHCSIGAGRRHWGQEVGGWGLALGLCLGLGLGGLSQLSILGGGFALANCVAAARFMWTQITVAWLMYAGGGEKGGQCRAGAEVEAGVVVL